MRRALCLVALGWLAVVLTPSATPVVTAQTGPARFIQIDRRAQLARADLDYDAPASRPEEGMPIGNGRMGTLVWTTPSALKMQINRVDVHAMDSTTFSFGRADSDFGYGCGFVDVNLADAGPDVFSPPSFRQHLSLYDALLTAQGQGVTARAVAWPGGDAIAIEIDDRRSQPSAINIDLRALRYQGQFITGESAKLRDRHATVFRTGAHSATSILGVDGNRITLVQQFKEDAFYDASAVAIGVVGRPSRARYLNETTVQLSAAPGPGRFTILIGSAASAQPSADIAAAALAQVRSAEARAFAGLQADTAAWWSDFWSRGAVHLHSASQQADFVEANYDYFLYLMGASSRGDYPPRFGGMLWQTDGDMSRWGSQYWWANTYAYYSNLMPANRIDLTDPMFKLYWGMYDAAARAAREQWGSQGIWIPETTFFNGPEPLPDDIAKELQDLMLVRKSWESRSTAFDWYANNKNRHNSRWNFRADGPWDHGYYMFQNKGSGVFGQTTHIMGVASRIANLAWQRYQFTGDDAWLRDRAYPLIRGAAEFYRNFPNLQKDADGVYHINHTNSGESAWNSRDAAYEVTCMHMIFPLAARASELLGVDAPLRPMWQEIKAHLVAPRPGSLCGTGSEIADNRPLGAFVYEGPGAVEPIGPEAALKAKFLGFTKLGSFIDAAGGGGARIFRNRLRLREGPGAIDAEHIAGLASGLHAALLISHPDAATVDDPVAIFTQWPKDWDAAFSLLARGGFVVTAAQIAGAVPLVEIQSTLGGPLRLANPWPGQTIAVYRDSRSPEEISGEVVTIATSRAEHLAVAPKGTTPTSIRIK